MISESKLNGDNLNSVRYETSRTFRNKKGEYLKEKVRNLKQNQNIKT
jgi:hypothetical protein